MSTARVWWLGCVIRPHASGLIICAHPRPGQEFNGLGNPHLIQPVEDFIQARALQPLERAEQPRRRHPVTPDKGHDVL